MTSMTTVWKIHMERVIFRDSLNFFFMQIQSVNSPDMDGRVAWSVERS